MAEQSPTQVHTPGINLDFFPSSTPKDIRQMLLKKFTAEKIVEIAIAGGDVIADAWRMFELPHNKTGEYQATIQVRIVEDENFVSQPAVEVGTPASQARFLEFGTSKEQAQPVMRPAYDYSVGYAKAKMLEKIMEIVR